MKKQKLRLHLRRAGSDNGVHVMKKIRLNTMMEAHLFRWILVTIR